MARRIVGSSKTSPMCAASSCCQPMRSSRAAGGRSGRWFAGDRGGQSRGHAGSDLIGAVKLGGEVADPVGTAANGQRNLAASSENGSEEGSRIGTVPSSSEAGIVWSLCEVAATLPSSGTATHNNEVRLSWLHMPAGVQSRHRANPSTKER